MYLSNKVRNEGPDLTPSTPVTVHWPYEAVSGKHLLYLMDVETPGANCTFRRGQVNGRNFRRKTVAPSSITDNSTNSVEAGQTRKRRNTDNNTVSSTKTPSKLTPSSKSGTAVPAPTVPQVKIATTIPPVQKIQTAEPEGVVLDCRKGTAKCTTFTCTAKNVGAFEGFQITVVSRIWNTTFITDYAGQTVSVFSYATVTVGTNSTYIVDTVMGNNKADVFTVLRPETPTSSKERLAVWKIVLAALAGIVLLVLLIFGLYKVGFFKRTRATFRKTSDANDANETLLGKKGSQKNGSEG